MNLTESFFPRGPWYCAIFMRPSGGYLFLYPGSMRRMLPLAMRLSLSRSLDEKPSGNAAARKVQPLWPTVHEAAGGQQGSMACRCEGIRHANRPAPSRVVYVISMAFVDPHPVASTATTVTFTMRDAAVPCHLVSFRRATR